MTVQHFEQQQQQQQQQLSPWTSVEPAEIDPIFTLTEQFHANPATNKVNLTIGIYQDDQGRPIELESVRQSRVHLQTLKAKPSLYLSSEGHRSFCHLSATTYLLDQHDIDTHKYAIISNVQTIGGSGAIRVSIEFIIRVLKCKYIAISMPTWNNHEQIISQFDDQVQLLKYAYYNEHIKYIDFKATLNDIQHMPKHSCVLFQLCNHNPTGIDFTREQWLRLLDVLETRCIIPIFDIAYHGFISGDVRKDTDIIRVFAARVPVIICQSFSKIMGLYGERIGNLIITSPCTSSSNALLSNARNLHSQLVRIIRCTYSNPPNFGAQIVHNLLQSKQLTELWFSELQLISKRLHSIRTLFVHKLNYYYKHVHESYWNFILNGHGMFTCIHLSREQILQLQTSYHIYITFESRVNLAALNPNNIDYVAQSICNVLSDFQSQYQKVTTNDANLLNGSGNGPQPKTV